MKTIILMNIFVYPISILTITVVFYALRKNTPIKICAACAGVAGTWGLSLVARYFGYPINETLTAMLMGGSVVGIMYQREKHVGGNVHVLKKTFFMIFGFAAMYGLFSYNLPFFGIGLIGAGIVYIFFGKTRYNNTIKSAETIALEKQMDEHCCD